MTGGAKTILMDGESAIVCGVLFAAAFVQAALGFGFALVAMSVLALSQGVVHAAGVVNIAGSVLIVGMSVALRRSIAWEYVVRVAPWAVVGVVAGVWTLSVLDPHMALRGLGLSIMCIAGWNLFGSSATAVRPSRLAEALAGLASGLLTGAFNEGGPPLIAHLYRRPYAPETLKGTAQLIFLVTGIVRLPTAAAQGHLTADVWWHAALAIPFVALGLIGGLRAARGLDTQRFQRVSWVALLLLGTYLAVFAGRSYSQPQSEEQSPQMTQMTQIGIEGRGLDGPNQ